MFHPFSGISGRVVDALVNEDAIEDVKDSEFHLSSLFASGDDEAIDYYDDPFGSANSSSASSKEAEVEVEVESEASPASVVTFNDTIVISNVDESTAGDVTCFVIKNAIIPEVDEGEEKEEEEKKKNKYVGRASARLDVIGNEGQ